MAEGWHRSGGIVLGRAGDFGDPMGLEKNAQNFLSVTCSRDFVRA